MSLQVFRVALMTSSPVEVAEFHVVALDIAGAAEQTMAHRPEWGDRRTVIESLGNVVPWDPDERSLAVAWFQENHPERRWEDLTPATKDAYTREANDWLAALSRARG